MSKTLQPQLNHQTQGHPAATTLRCSKWPCGPWNTQGCLPILKSRVQRHSDNSKVTEQRPTWGFPIRVHSIPFRVSKHHDPKVTPVCHPQPDLHPFQICPKSFQNRNHDPGSCGGGGPTSPQPAVMIQRGAHATSSSARGSLAPSSPTGRRDSQETEVQTQGSKLPESQ